MKAGTHPKLPNAKVVKSNGQKLEGKKIATIAVDFEKVETKKDADELDKAIQSAVSKIQSQFDYTANNVVSVSEMYASEQKKLRERNQKQLSRVEKQYKDLGTAVSKLDPSIRSKVPPEITKGIQAFS